MPGIDLIDLNDPLLRKREKNALRLIVNPEDEYPINGKEFWYLWTAKEAVFKNNRDLTNFDPKAIPIQIQSGEPLVFKSNNVEGRIFDYKNLVIAITDRNIDNIIFHFFKKETENVSSEARHKLAMFIKEKHQIDINVVQDGNGLPIIDYLELPVSFTHHAEYIAFAYPKF